jgi:hypothetical protein
MLTEASINVMVLAMDIRRYGSAYGDKPSSWSDRDKPSTRNAHTQNRVEAHARSNVKDSGHWVKNRINAERVMLARHL